MNIFTVWHWQKQSILIDKYNHNCILYIVYNCIYCILVFLMNNFCFIFNCVFVDFVFLYQQQQLCYTIGSTIFALAWRVQPCFAALLCACLFAHDCEYTRTHAHTTRKYTYTHTGTKIRRHTSRSGFVVFVRIRRMRCRRPFCVHVCERQCR